MAKYNVGDKVMVRKDINTVTGARGIPGMTKFAGEEVTISRIDPIKMEIDTYLIEEDDAPMPYVWSNVMFEEVASDKKNPMPELTTGMFGKNDNGDLFVVVNDLIVYQKGTWDWVSDVTDGTLVVDALYESKCFKKVEVGKADVIWERDTTDDEDDDEFDDALKELSDFMDFLLECAKSKDADKK